MCVYKLPAFGQECADFLTAFVADRLDHPENLRVEDFIWILLFEIKSMHFRLVPEVENNRLA
jgi:hypothetical protein